MLEGQYDTHLQSGTKNVDPACACCQASEEDNDLFEYVTGERLCIDCLAKAIDKDIQNSGDGRVEYLGHVFRRTTEPWARKFGFNYEADMQDGDPMLHGSDVYDVVEAVLMRKKLI